MDNGDYVSYSQLLSAIYGLDIGSAYRIKKRGGGIPYRFKRVRNCKFKVVYLPEFWKWAEENKLLLDFSKMEEGILGEEPDWVKVKRRLDYQRARKYITTPWTEDDDRKLDRLVREGKYTLDQLSAIFRRREGAVRRRIYDLCIDTKPKRNKPKPWTSEEVQHLLFRRQEGASFELIGEELGRSVGSCRGRMERLENPGCMTREYRRARKELRNGGQI